MNEAHKQDILAALADKVHVNIEDLENLVDAITLEAVCQKAVDQVAPWIDTLDELEQTAINGLMMHLLKTEIGKAVKAVRSDLKSENPPQGVPAGFSLEQFQHLRAAWQDHYSQHKDLAGLAAYALAYLRHGPLIFHILPWDDWVPARMQGLYTPLSLETEGFIHCSEFHQVLRSANLYFKGQQDIALLWIAVERVTPETRFEDLTGEKILFPHIYGALNLEAVVNITALPVNEDGQFDRLPADISRLVPTKSS